MQIMIKGKRTKRQRLITMTSSSENSGTVEEEEDMANCLILLAQGHHHLHTQKKSTSHHVAAPHNNNGEKLYLHQCKTCNRCFSSFQALGGHRVSHKKIPKSNTAVTTTFVNEDYGPTNTALTLQLSNRAMYSNSSNNTMASTYKSNKVHECSICGAEFTSGQALGGHMRRHRSTSSLSMRSNIIRSPQTHEAKIHRNVLKLDLNLPAPENDDDDDDDDRESKFPFQAKDKVIAFSANSLVDCHTEVQV